MDPGVGSTFFSLYGSVPGFVTIQRFHEVHQNDVGPNSWGWDLHKVGIDYDNENIRIDPLRGPLPPKRK